jgi:serine protease Do
MSGRMDRFTKMIMLSSKTVRRLLCATIMAVFFSPTTRAVDSSLFTLEQGLSELVFRISRSVVTVEASSSLAPGPSRESNREIVRRLVSTGLICDSAGHVLVSAPAISGHDRITVVLDGYPMPAELVGIDYHTNLALLQIDRSLGEAVALSDKRACAGQMVVAMGNSYGLRAAPSLGFCAGLRIDGLMQFSVPITSGSIGGGVFDMNGELLGVIVDGEGTESRVALAVPAYQLPAVISYLSQRGDRHAGFLGIQSADIEIIPPLEIATPVRLVSANGGDRMTFDRGIIVTSVLPGSPAANGGVLAGDLIVGYNDIAYLSAAELARAVRCSRPGSVCTIEIIRQNQALSRTVQVGRKELDPTHLRARNTDYQNARDGEIDSLTSELIRVKRQLEALESRLRTLRN